MNENKKGYYVYSCIAVIFGMGLFAFFGWLIYDLILKLSNQDFSDNTVVQALITLIITVFIGGYFSKWLEIRNHKKLELYKIRTSISLKIIDLATILYHHPESMEAKELLIAESHKVKLYFDDDLLKNLNQFMCEEDKDLYYNRVIDDLKKNIK
jgi:ABC-type multidrug transport system fused ATPase/permease subunit